MLLFYFLPSFLVHHFTSLLLTAPSPQVPKLEIRLSAMASALSVKETSANILSSAETILTAVNEVRGSGRLKFLLKAFLDLNNALNKAAKAQ